MAKIDLPTPDELRQLLTYDPDTGLFTWLPRRLHLFDEGPRQEVHQRIWNTRYANKPAFTGADKMGYLCGRCMHANVKAHRVAWAYVYGEWPQGDIDHINGNPADNRIANLRVVSHAENMRNMKMPVTNKSGEVGIWKDPLSNSYSVRIGKRLHVGRWPTMEEAKAARHAAMKVLHYHENHGRA